MSHRSVLWSGSTRRVLRRPMDVMELNATLSSSGPVLDYAPPARRALLSRVLAARGFWALTDQGVCSLGNFLTNLVLGQHLSQHAYGVYALIFYYVLVFLNTLHGAMITYPLTLRGASATPRQMRRLVLRGLTFTGGLSPVLSILILAACVRLDRMSMFGWAVLAMVLWQVQETLRRALLARLCHRCAIPGDIVSFLGQAGAVYYLSTYRELTPELALACVALTSGLAAIIQFSQILWQGRHPDFDAAPESPMKLIAEAISWVRAGRWIALSCLVNVGTIYVTPWVLEAARGEGAVGSLTILNSLLNLTNPVVFGIAGLVVPAVAAARARAATPRQGWLDARAVATRYTLVGLTLLLPYYLTVLIAPEMMIKLLYRDAAAQYLHLVDETPYLVAIYGTLFIAYMFVSLLNGLGESRASFLATVASTVVTLLLVVPMTLAYGLRGALFAGVVPILTQVGVLFVMAVRVARRDLSGAGFATISRVARQQATVAGNDSDELPAIPPEQPRLRVLVNAYAMSPYRGSEPGVGWGYCAHLAKYHDLTVLCAAGTPGAEENIFREEMEACFRENGPIQGLTLAYVERPLLSRVLQREDEFHRRTFYYLGYNAWQRAALRLALKLHAEKPFDLVHQLNMTGFREPGYLWKLPIPFVWGPIAGAANIPSPFLRIMTPLDRLYYGFRNWTTSFQKWSSSRCRRAAQRASHIWTIGHASQDLVEKIWGYPSETLGESGATRQPDARIRHHDSSRPLRVVWSGVHIGRKALPLLLNAVATLENQVDVRVVILGGGSLEKAWKSLSAKLGIESRVQFAGRMTRAQAMKEVAAADVLAFTSIQDGTPQAVLEAMSLGVPVICHDACGMGVAVDETCGLKIPLIDPATSVAGFADAIRRLASEPALLGQLSAGAIERTKDLDWTRMAERVAEVYTRVVSEEATVAAQTLVPVPMRLGSLQESH